MCMGHVQSGEFTFLSLPESHTMGATVMEKDSRRRDPCRVSYQVYVQDKIDELFSLLLVQPTNWAKKNLVCPLLLQWCMCTIEATGFKARAKVRRIRSGCHGLLVQILVSQGRR